MNFSSLPFAAFFVVVFAAYWSLRGKTARHGLLLLASYAFYMSWNPWLLTLIVGSTLLDFTVGRQLARAGNLRTRRAWLIVSLIGNLGVLAVFKYADFFIGSFGALVEAAGFQANYSTLGLILPVGISFYTFQTLSYTIDIYRGRIEPEPSLLRFALFVAFFPQLVAGPIVKAREFLPQLQDVKRFDWKKFDSAMMLILIGLTKKVLIADNLAGTANSVFNNPGIFSTRDLWLGMLCYAGQIYGDFSGYSDMAIGFARLLGFDLCINFASPYLALSLTGFWRRWHISLSTWLRDYLYIPLGGSHGGRSQTARNLMITMLLGGLWHGASWTFVVWGAIHGAALVVHKCYLWMRERVQSPPMLPLGAIGLVSRGANIAACWAVTFLVVNIAWVFFRCQPHLDSYGMMEPTTVALERAVYIVTHLFVPATPAQPHWLMNKLPMVMLLGFVAAFHLYEEWRRRGYSAIRLPALIAGPTYAAWLLIILIYCPEFGNPFIYFQF